jgi:hypothetical protein
MENKNQLFNTIEPNENLKNSIIIKIKKEEMKRAMYKIVFSSFVSFASVSMAIIFAINIVKDAYQSGIFEYLSLLFSDGMSLVSYWQSYAMSIVESLPVFQITVVFASAWAFIWSLNTILPILKNTKSVFYKIS